MDIILIDHSARGQSRVVLLPENFIVIVARKTTDEKDIEYHHFVLIAFADSKHNVLYSTEIPVSKEESSNLGIADLFDNVLTDMRKDIVENLFSGKSEDYFVRTKPEYNIIRYIDLADAKKHWKEYLDNLIKAQDKKGKKEQAK